MDISFHVIHNKTQVGRDTVSLDHNYITDVYLFPWIHSKHKIILHRDIQSFLMFLDKKKIQGHNCLRHLENIDVWAKHIRFIFLEK